MLVAVVLVAVSPFVPSDKANEDRARLACQSIVLACEAYCVSPQNEKGTYPTILLELVKPPFGGASFLRDMAKDLIDPWGKMFRYEVAKDEKGKLRPYVWTERTVDGKTKVIGTKPPEPKKK